MSDFVEIIAAHDAAVAHSGLEIWIGSEPTFTLRSSEQPQWLSQALGGDKQDYALRLVRELQRRHPGSAILSTVGRQYAGEKVPRWSYGLYQLRDGQPVWQGPSDPLMGEQEVDDSKRLYKFLDRLTQALLGLEWSCRSFVLDVDEAEVRLLVRPDGVALDELDLSDKRFSRTSVHQHKTPDSGLVDDLAAEGYLLFTIDLVQPVEIQRVIRVEMPHFGKVDDFLLVLDLMGNAASAMGLSHLLMAGFPPPVDDRVAWTTVTPDPAVIEINQAPQPDVARFYKANAELFEIAEELGLSPWRLYYNGKMSDSGGGGQFTLGGRTAESSPFFEVPELLPRLIRYVNAHPSLSYLFATDYVGGASQSPRTDESMRDRFHELGIALDLLHKNPEINREFLYLSLASFLSDASGNTHRSELNIEKLWNTGLPQRGCLGLLEFRAFRMPYTAQRSVAIAMLLRGITAMLAKTDAVPQLIDWQDELHERYALPFFLRRDLLQVFQDLNRAGFGLSGEFESELLTDANRSVWSFEFDGGELRIEQAVEFWPLVGDVATQESGGSRLVDSSTVRLQLSLIGNQLDDWVLQVEGYQLPLRAEIEDAVEHRLIGLRFRDFTPWRGLHPSIAPVNPLNIQLVNKRRELAYQGQLFNWRPGITPYDGLPNSLEEAASRRQERFIVKPVAADEVASAQSAPSAAVGQFTFDLRRL